MSSSNEQQAKRRQEANEDIDYVLCNLWNISLSSAFCNAFRQNTRFTSDMIMCCKLCYDYELKKDFNASESEIREIRTLCFYSCYLFYENKPWKRYSSIVKEDCVKLKSQPRLWKSLDKDYQATLQHYLDSPIPKIIALTIELPELDDSTSSSNIPSSEYNLSTIIDKEDSAESFITSQEHNSSASITSNEEQPTLNSVFHQMTGSSIKSSNEKVENRYLTSSEKEEINSVLHELSCSSHSSNGRGFA